MKNVSLGLVIMMLAGTTEAALVGRDLDGNAGTAEAYYDTALNVTWLADANLADTSGYSPGGAMTWPQTLAWIASLNAHNSGAGYLGFNGWRLPNLNVNNDSILVYCGVSTTSEIACRDSELGYMFWQNGVSTAAPGPFSNVLYRYWANPYNSGTDGARLFSMEEGWQTDGTYVQFSHSAWAVHSGDIGVAAVPIPAAAWLFGSALGAVGWMRRKSA